jgi:hypothetical protein
VRIGLSGILSQLEYGAVRLHINHIQTLHFIVQIANNYEVGCGTGRLGGEYVCDLDARYQEFVISFNASITEQMSEETFEKLVMSLDEQFEDFLSR